MKHLAVFVCLLLATALAPAKAARADLIISYSNVSANWEYSGTYMFTVAGNDSQILRNGGANADALQLLHSINAWFSANENVSDHYLDALNLYHKYENGASGERLSIGYGNTQRYGTWTSDFAIEFYAIKAGNSFALYWLGEDGATSGMWTAEHVALVGNGNIPGLSHFTGYNPKFREPPIPNPEPASMLLFGTGALAFAALRRKIKKT